MKYSITMTVFVLLAPLGAQQSATVAKQPPIAVATGADSAVLVGAGDIATCDGRPGAAETGQLLEHVAGTVMAVGDLAYPDGSAESFAHCYAPTWGRVRARTRPAPGNHEFHSAQATPYFAYFGAAAGNPATGYYSYQLGAWHVVVLNSECAAVGGCDAGSPQERWLRADLAAHPARCTVAYWHIPLFSSGAKHGNAPEIAPLWQALYDGGAELVINGHDHDYERFAPQTPSAGPDTARGIREFVVGTGGKTLRPFGAPRPNSEVRNADTYGVLRLTLLASSYRWEFIPVTGQTFRDAGAGHCH